MKTSKDLDYRKVLSLRTDNPKVDDPTYGFWWEHIKENPLMISYPRTGAHWINAVIELYFDRPRLPARRATFLDPSRDDWGWFHDHDTIAWDKLHLENNNDLGVLYLYRNPVPTIFSWIVYNFNKGQSLRHLAPEKLETFVVAVAQQYRDHLTKWLIDTENTTAIRYENFQDKPVGELFKVFNTHFKKQAHDFDEERAQACFDIVTPVELSKRRTEWKTLSDFMLTDEYKKDRSVFAEKYSDLINSIVITKDLKEFFE